MNEIKQYLEAIKLQEQAGLIIRSFKKKNNSYDSPSSEMIRILKRGELQIHNTGSLEQLREILETAFKESKRTYGEYEYYIAHSPYSWSAIEFPRRNILIVETKDFYKKG